MTIKFLIITSNFGQPNNPSSYHIDDRVVQLKKLGYNITVITEHPPETIPSDILKQIQVHVVNRRKIFKYGPEIFNKIVNRVSTLQRKVKLRVGIREDRFGNWSWRRQVVNYIRKNLNVNTYDILYSTGGPAVSHLIAGDIAVLHDIKWVAEIQDPLLFEEICTIYKASKNDLKNLEQAEAILKQSKALICLTKECANDYRKRLNKEHVYSIYPGFDWHEFTSLLSQQSQSLSTISRQKLIIFYAGTLNSVRNLTALVDAIKRLELEDKMTIKVAGYIDGPTKMLISREAAFIEYLGTLTPTGVVENLLNCDLTLVIQNIGSVSRWTIPSKFYMYGKFGKPILFLGYHNSEVENGAIAGNFYYADQADALNITLVIQSIIEDHNKGMLKVPVYISIKKATEQFINICSIN